MTFDLLNEDFKHLIKAEIEKNQITAILLVKKLPTSLSDIGRTKQGGLPNLPDYIEWPYWAYGKSSSKNYLHFLAQVDCSELPKVDEDYPEKGMLFFFGYMEGGSSWHLNDNPAFDKHQYRIIYVEDVPQNTPVRKPPKSLIPIYGISEDNHRAGQLWDSVVSGKTHEEWPLVPITSKTIRPSHITSKFLGLNEKSDEAEEIVKLARDFAQQKEEKLHYANIKCSLKPHMQELLKISGYFTNRYKRDLGYKFYVGSTKIMEVRNIPFENNFPYFGAFMYHFAAALGNNALYYGRLEQKNSNWPEVYGTARRGYFLKRKYENTVAEARKWMKRAYAEGLKNNVPSDVATQFRNWVINSLNIPRDDIKSKERSKYVDHANYALISCLTALFERAAMEPQYWEKIDLKMLSLMADVYEPFYKYLGGKPSMYYEAFHHQILGHFNSYQFNNRNEQKERLNLFQFVLPREGQITFFIDRENLKKRNFNQAEPFSDWL